MNLATPWAAITFITMAAPDDHTDPRSYEWSTTVNGTFIGGAIGQSLPYFSNPNVLYRGIPTGFDGTGPTAQNNAAIMNSNAASVSAFRAQVVPDTTGPVAQLGTVSTSSASSGGQRHHAQHRWLGGDGQQHRYRVECY